MMIMMHEHIEWWGIENPPHTQNKERKEMRTGASLTACLPRPARPLLRALLWHCQRTVGRPLHRARVSLRFVRKPHVSGGEASAPASAEVLCGKERGGVSRLHLCGFIVKALDSKRRSKPHMSNRQLHALHHTHERRRIAGGHTGLAVHQPGDMLCSQRFSNREEAKAKEGEFDSVKFDSRPKREHNERGRATACLNAPWSYNTSLVARVSIP